MYKQGHTTSDLTTEDECPLLLTKQYSGNDSIADTDNYAADGEHKTCYYQV